jgi:tetratricopeptide (TPR) repeat protein
VVRAFLKRATELHGVGRFDEALRLYDHVVLRNPGVLSAQYFRATIDIETGNLTRALDRLRQLSLQDPSSFDGLYALAFTFGELGEWESAAEAYRRALALKAHSTAARFALAQALEVTGKLDGAMTLYRELAALPVVRLRSLIGVAHLDPSQIEGAECEEMTAAVADGSTPVGLKIGLYFALGEVVEARGAYDRAFAMFSTGNALRRQNITDTLDLPDDIVIAPPRARIRAEHPEAVAARHAELIVQQRRIFTPQFLARHAGLGHPTRAPIFIIGMPRSGSTLIEQILSSHRQVEGLGETPAVWDAIRAVLPPNGLAGGGDLSPEHLRSLAEAYLMALRCSGWRKSAFVVDKMLGNYLNLGLIHLMFPNATILHSVRDPVDTCLGSFRKLFRTGNETTYDLRDIGAHYVRYREMMAHWEAVLPEGRITTVSHEALLLDPEGRIRWLVEAACGLKWDANCLSFHRTKRPVRTSSVAQVRRPVFRSSMERWRNYSRHLGPLFEALGPFAPPR